MRHTDPSIAVVTVALRDKLGQMANEFAAEDVHSLKVLYGFLREDHLESQLWTFAFLVLKLGHGIGAVGMASQAWLYLDIDGECADPDLAGTRLRFAREHFLPVAREDK